MGLSALLVGGLAVSDTRLRRKRTPWDRIIRAANAGTGCRLSFEDVRRLAMDGAIEVRGDMDADCYDAGHDPYTCQEIDCE